MTDRPAIFVSATSGEFRSFRLALKRQLERKGVLMIVQDEFPTDYGEVREMLASRIRESDAVICLVGFGYGAEPQQRPADGRRRSYTQLEYDLACELGKALYVFLSDEQHRLAMVFPMKTPNAASFSWTIEPFFRAAINFGIPLPITSNSGNSSPRFEFPRPCRPSCRRVD
jgi:Domain of unknown function (DUF4062)